MRFAARIPSIEHLFRLKGTETLSGGWKLFAVLVLAWTGAEWQRTKPLNGDEDPSWKSPSPVPADLVKLAFGISFYAWQRWLSGSQVRKETDYGEHVDGEEGLPLNGLGRSSHEDLRPEAGLPGNANGITQYMHSNGHRIPLVLSIILVILAALSLCSSNYYAMMAEQLTDPFTVYTALSCATLGVIPLSYIFLSRELAVLLWQAILLQLCGFGIVQATIIKSTLSNQSILYLAGLAFSTAAGFILLDIIYTTSHTIPFGALHVVLFFVIFLVDILPSTLTHGPSRTLIESHIPERSSTALMDILLQIVREVAILGSIYAKGAVTTGVLLSSSMAAYILLVVLFSKFYTAGLLLGLCVVLTGSVSYLFYLGREEGHHSQKRVHWLLRVVTMTGASIVATWLVVTTYRTNPNLSLTEKPISVLGRVKDTLQVEKCHRRPLIQFYPHERKYHNFDNILLIVFFSHARYDINLDYYREVYAEFFPNIVFVGPGSREDAGFRHSYDVLVDSYESDEDLSDTSFYKMAGRMAHHMLYTAMKEHDCYDGYLWAPFDTLLNIPRLQQFDQNYFWYHSPFGQYVHNSALGDAHANANKTRHPPPLNISPDPALNLTATWRGWMTDWWWGDPHVGVEVCMRAYKKVPLEMREHLASLTNGTRLIGGSADTLYIPGRHRESFMDILGLFLETDCFLEIATPTAVHLVSPPGEPILYVDHWWIWQAPFNASFVRNQWDDGFEVDTFHTFHWGDKGEDGVWRGEPKHIEDVRHLLAESALRQGIEWQYGVHPEVGTSGQT